MEEFISWNKSNLKNYFLQNMKKEIILEKIETSFQITGYIEEIREIDMCSRIITETCIRFKTIDERVYITLHDTFIGVQTKNRIKKIIPEEIFYNKLVVKKI